MCGISGQSAKLRQALGRGPRERKRREQRLVLGLLGERTEEEGRAQTPALAAGTPPSMRGPTLPAHGRRLLQAGKTAGLHKQHEEIP